MLRRETNHQIAVQGGRATRQDQQAAIRSSKCRDDALDIRSTLDKAGHKFDRKWPRYRLRRTHKIFVGVVFGFASRAARLRFGAISLSIATHFPAIPSS